MKIYLRDRNLELTQAWGKAFKNHENVYISCGDIFSDKNYLNLDAIISPANSFGYMDGGIDYVYSEYFGWGVSAYLREKIWQNHYGELLVGESCIINMQEIKEDVNLEKVKKMKYLISSPTMRVPMDVSKTVNAYLAFKSALRIAKKYNINSILCPGLATSIGKMSYDNCAYQMLKAYEEYLNPVYYDLLGVAKNSHMNMIERI